MEHDLTPDERLSRLEGRLESLESEVAGLRAGVSPGKYVRSGGRQVRKSFLDVSWSRLADLVAGEGAVGRIGIILTVLGTVYAVQYGIDEGWITEGVRVGLAFVIGFVLLGLGMRLRSGRPMLARLMTGGGFAALYVAIVAAQSLYGMIPFWLGLAGMTLVTAGCFVLGTRQKDSAMAVVAVFGGLSTPFLLQSDTASIPGVVAYVCVILAATGLLFWRHGWRSLILSSALGSLPAAAIILTFLQDPDPILFWDQIAVTCGIVFAGLLFGVLPVLRTRPGAERPMPPVPKWLTPEPPRFVMAAIPGFAVLLVWTALQITWSPDSLVAGGIGVAMGLVAVGFSRRLWEDGHTDMSMGLLAGGAATLAGGLVTGADEVGVGMALWTMVAALLFEDAHRRNLRHPRIFGYALLIPLIFWMPGRFGGSAGSFPFDSLSALGDAVAVGALGFIAWVAPKGRLRLVLAGATWLAVLALLGREMGSPGAVTAAWSLVAVILIVAGLRGGWSLARLAGMLTVAVVVAKLLLFDLSRIEPIVRIGLFLGFGGALLALSYFWPTWWKTEPEDGPEAEASPEEGAPPEGEKQAEI